MYMGDSLSFHAYSNEEFVKKYAEKIKANAFNAFYEQPATISLLPKDISNKKVLDAGCGPGWYANYLLQHGAQVTAVDFSEQMVAHTKKNTANSVKTFQLDLNGNLSSLKNEQFDIIICALVIHYIHDLEKLFIEFYKILSNKGVIIFSTVHPGYNTPSIGTTYFEKELIYDVWEEGELITFYRRSFNDIIQPIINAGFHLDILLEPKPTEHCKIQFPEIYNDLLKKPYFICFRISKHNDN